MNPIQHSQLSCRKFGGNPEDPVDYSVYLKVHKFLDSSKLYCWGWQHRALLHNNWGIELSTRLFGDFLTGPDGKEKLIRDIAAEHIREDCDNKVPTMEEWLSHLFPISTGITTGVPNFDFAKASKIPLVLEHLKLLHSMAGRLFIFIVATDFFRDILLKFCTLEEVMSLSFPAMIKDRLRLLKKECSWMNAPVKTDLQWLKQLNEKSEKLGYDKKERY